jgi:hypothetical protein
MVEPAMSRREFSKLLKAEIMNRCKVPTGWQCEECGLIVQSGEIDHTIAEALIVDKTKKLTASDGKFLCVPCHQGPEGKTPKDKGIIAKAKRIEAKHIGADRPAGNIKSAGFAKSDKKPAIEKRPAVDIGMTTIERRFGVTR